MRLNLNLSEKKNGLLIGAAIALFSSAFFGFTGFKVFFGFIILSYLPFYFLLEKTELEEEEKAVFPLFLGLGIFPAVAYWIGVVLPFKAAIASAFFVISAITLFVRALQKKKAGKADMGKIAD